MRNLGAIEMFGSVEEIVYEIVDIVIREEVSPENMKENGKRKRSSDQKLKTDEENLPSMKTASSTRKQEPARKTTLPEDNGPHI